MKTTTATTIEHLHKLSRDLLREHADENGEYSGLIGNARDAIDDYAHLLKHEGAEDARDAEFWRFCVDNGWPHLVTQLYPDEVVLGWTMKHDEPNCVYYGTAADCVAAAIASERSGHEQR